ncbi:MAG: POTRA domain-containing protein [Lacunisphaera sp.]
MNLFRRFAGRLVQLGALLLAAGAMAQEKPAPAATAPAERYFINEYRVAGARSLARIDVEAAVYPFLGPGRTSRDIELARAALEKAYADAGYQTVGVSLPPQNVAGGIVELRVIERPVGRLRVKGAKYSSPQKMKAQAASVAEGRVMNFNEIPADLAALNQLPDRRVSPALRPGVAPDTVDVDLEVKETSPVHASVDVNNRQAPSTEPLRANVSVSVNTSRRRATRSASATRPRRRSPLR